MLKIYCQKCGSKNDYASVAQKPNYCQSCGNCLNPSLVKEKLAATKLEVDNSNDENREDEDHDDGDETEASVPNLKKIDIDVDYGRKKTESFKNLIGTRDKNIQPYDNLEDFKPLIPPQTEKEFMDEFKREASALRPKKPEK